MDDIITTDETLAGAADVTAADGSGADSQPAAAIKLDDLNQVLGKQFPTVEAALKSVKDTFGYVGSIGQLKKQVEELKNSPAPEKVSELEARINESEFYQEHPEYKEHKALIRRFGSDPAQAVADPEFQKIFEAVKAGAEAGKDKSVIHSNARLGQVTEKTAEIKAAIDAGKTTEAARLAATAALESAGIISPQ